MIAVDRAFSLEPAEISEVSVTATLDGLIYNTQRQSSKSLQNLMLVDEALLDAALPHTPCNRKYTFVQILTAIITTELARHRAAVGISYSAPELSRDIALQRIVADAKHSELRAWSCLYYRYVRVDLDISLSLFCQAAHIHVRTFPRDKAHAIERLVVQLVEREQLARKAQHKRRLRAQLPLLTCDMLFGREAELKRIADLTRCLAVPHFQIIGERGVGKTAFVRGAIESLIERAAIDELLWLEASTSLLEVQQQLNQLMREQGFSLSLREFLQHRRVAVVLDSPQPCICIPLLQDLLYCLESAVVYVITSEPIPLKNFMHYIILSELHESAAHRLIQALLDRWHLPYRDLMLCDDAWNIWEIAGGNPACIRQIVHELELEQIRLLSSRITPRYVPATSTFAH